MQLLHAGGPQQTLRHDRPGEAIIPEVEQQQGVREAQVRGYAAENGRGRGQQGKVVLSCFSVTKKHLHTVP